MKTAVMVVDMQREFVEIEDAPFYNKHAKDIIPDIKRLLNVARESQIPIVYVVERHRADGTDFGLELEKGPKHCIEGSGGEEIVDELRPKESDYVLTKRRYSAFYMTDLEILLKGLRIDTIVLTGGATNCCLRATAEDAFFRDYHVILPKECVIGTEAKAHEVNLKDIDDFYGQVLALSKVIGMLAARK